MDLALRWKKWVKQSVNHDCASSEWMCGHKVFPETMEVPFLVGDLTVHTDIAEEISF